MSESLKHQQLVELTVEYMNTIVPDDNKGLINVDLPGYDRPTLSFESVIPDAIYFYNDLYIIGEAKTVLDFKTDHSIGQYDSYFNELESRNGKRIIIIAIPWELFITAKNYFSFVKKNRNSDVEVVVISENGIKETI